MALSVLERTREIGLLRALGLTRRQLRTAVRIESVLVAVVGGQLLRTLVALAAVGGAAAAWPARRATRINLLAAIATE